MQDEVESNLVVARPRAPRGSPYGRRRSRTVSRVLVAVALILSAASAGCSLTSADEPAPPVGSSPVGPAPSATPTPTSSDVVATGPQRRQVTYAEHHRIHWGDQVIDVGQTVQSVAATDDGVVFVRGDKACPYEDPCRTLWFTHGAEPVRVGVVTGSWIRGYGLEIARSGSTVVWSEPELTHGPEPYADIGEYVVYDTSLQREVGRFGSARSGVVAVGADVVFWVPRVRHQCVGFYGVCRRLRAPVMRFDMSTGEQTALSYAAYRAERLTWPRTLLSPLLEEVDEGTVVRPPHAAPKIDDVSGFLVHDGRLVGDDGSIPVTLRLARTGEALRLRVPRRYPDDAALYLLQWLDDDHVVVGDEDGRLLVCPVPRGRCRTVVATKGHRIVGFNGRG